MYTGELQRFVVTDWASGLKRGGAQGERRGAFKREFLSEKRDNRKKVLEAQGLNTSPER